MFMWFKLGDPYVKMKTCQIQLCSITSPSKISGTILFFAGILFLLLSAPPVRADQEYVQGEIILKLDPQKIGEGRGSVFPDGGSTLKPIFQRADRQSLHSTSVQNELSNLYKMKVETGKEIQQCEVYGKTAGVVYAEPNYIHQTCISPNDPDFAQQWSLPKIKAEQAWDTTTGTRDVIIAVIDTGIDHLHEDLDANIWRNAGEIPDNGFDDDGNGFVDDSIGWDFVDASGCAAGEDCVDPDNDPMDRHGHGTHVAGIAGAVSNNSSGVAGVAWNCRIMPVRAGYKTASGGGVLESDDAAQAIVYAAENGAHVLNLSWGDNQKSSLIEDAVRFATERGVLVCAAAGNENGSSLVYPAALENSSVMAIGATDAQDKRAYFSNFGDWVHLSAPGTSIHSTYLNNTCTAMSGTSMSTPLVVGQAALILSQFPGLTPPQIKARIMRSVDVLQNLADQNITSGRINAHTSLTAQYATPHIFSLTPNLAHERDDITLFGDRFGAAQGTGRVSFSPGLDAEISSWSECEIKIRVPEGAESGNMHVVTSEGTSNDMALTILPIYYDETLIGHTYLGGGMAQGWQADDQTWSYSLPFSFPFFGQDHDTVYVCSNGFLDFTDASPTYLNSQAGLKTRTIIAPLWDDLTTNGTDQQGEDIYIYSPSSDSVCFRWAGQSYETGGAIHVEAVLYRDGRIQFNYGPGNTGLSPTIGISGGGGEDYDIGLYDGKSALTEVQSVLFTPRQQSFTIPLDSGWNLISLPLKPDNNQVGQVMGDLNGGIESVWSYENGIWYVYDPQHPELSDLQSMKTGYGYWIKTTREGLSLQIQGRPCPMSFNLTNGWNLIGFNSLQSMPIQEALEGVQGGVECAWGYEDGVWSVYVPQNPGLSDLEDMAPGMGYWICRRTQQ